MKSNPSPNPNPSFQLSQISTLTLLFLIRDTGHNYRGQFELKVESRSVCYSFAVRERN